MVYMLLGTGFEETEAIAPLDLLRRAGVDVLTVGVTGKTVYGSHKIGIEADITIDEMDLTNLEMIILPGGLGGVASARASRPALDALDFATTLDIRQRILIMEDMEGRNDKENNNAGYALFRSRKNDYGRLHDIMARMMELSDKDRDDIDCLTAEGKIGWTDTYARYLKTADRCERAEAKYLI